VKTCIECSPEIGVGNTTTPSDSTRQLEEELAMEMLCNPDDIVFFCPVRNYWINSTKRCIKPQRNQHHKEYWNSSPGRRHHVSDEALFLAFDEQGCLFAVPQQQYHTFHHRFVHILVSSASHTERTFHIISLFCPNLRSCDIRFRVRLNSHIPDETAVMFPVQFLSNLMTGNMKHCVDEARDMYSNLLESNMIIMPITKKTLSATVALVNPNGIMTPEPNAGRSSFMLFLDPGNVVTPQDMSNIARRLRIFLNHLAQKGVHNRTDKPFNGGTYKYYKIPGTISIVLCDL